MTRRSAEKDKISRCEWTRLSRLRQPARTHEGSASCLCMYLACVCTTTYYSYFVDKHDAMSLRAPAQCDGARLISVLRCGGFVDPAGPLSARLSAVDLAAPPQAADDCPACPGARVPEQPDAGASKRVLMIRR